MKAPAFLYRCPHAVEEVLSLLAEYRGDAQVLAGGQSLIPSLNMRLSSPRLLIDINRIEQLRSIEERRTAVSIGAMARHVDLLISPLITRGVPLLAMVVPYVGHPAVRNRGTVGGSIAFADPSAEIPAIAVALNANIVLRGLEAERTVSARSFYRGLYQTHRNEDELICDITFPTSTSNDVFGFSELSRRRGDFAVVGVAVAGQKTASGGISALNIVIFGSEPKPLLISMGSHETIPVSSKEDFVAEIAQDIVQRMDPIGNHQGRADTKRRQAAALLRRVFKDMLHRAADA